MAGLVKQALKFTPHTNDTQQTLTFLRGMNQTFTAHYTSEVKSQDAAIETAKVPDDCVVVRFDGGTPCNVPAKGYGEGYGSFQIGEGTPPIRMKYGQPMSANCAEIRTATEALKEIARRHGLGKWVHIIGDSQIALKWVNAAHSKEVMKVSKGSSQPFVEAIQDLYEVASGFEKIITEWQPRHKMVAVFGH